MKQLEEEFFKRDAFEVAPELVGKVLSVRQPDGDYKSLRILETEVYCGEDDSASQARFGPGRAGALYEEGGALYICKCDEDHLLNFVTGKKDYPQAVMIRTCEGADEPGKVTAQIGISPSWSGRRLNQVPGFSVLDDGIEYDTERLPRIGIDEASAEDQDKLWRYKALTDDEEES